MILHILPQELWHDPAVIAGTRGAIAELRDALTRALEPPHQPHQARVFADDGEGYRVFVRVGTEAEMRAIPYGYTDAMACGEGREWPEWARID